MEDIGNADPQALPLATSAQQAFEFLGAPEGLLALDQLTLYLATAPKSNKIELAHFAAQKAVQTYGDLAVPVEYRNAPTQVMKAIGYGKGYQYDHDFPQAYAGQEHLPAKIAGQVFYNPTQFGFEKEIVCKDVFLGRAVIWGKEASFFKVEALCKFFSTNRCRETSIMSEKNDFALSFSI